MGTMDQSGERLFFLSTLASFIRPSPVQFAQVACLVLASFLTHKSQAEPRIQGSEDVIAFVECFVKETGELKSYLGINKGSLIRIETLSSYVSTLLIDKDVFITGFPAVLNFDVKRKFFYFSGTSEDTEEGSSVSLEIAGSLAPRGDAHFVFNVVDRDVDAAGVARLIGCKRFK